MKTTIIRNLQLSCIGIVALGILIFTFSEKTDSQEAVSSYEIDSVHSSVIFRAKHKGVAYVYGRFNEFSGNITLDKDDTSKSKVDFQVKTESIDSANAKRDQHLRSPDFFNAKQFPVLTFKSTEVSAKAGQENMLEVTGDFNLHGVKKSITIDVEITGEKKSQADEIIGFLTTFEIKRSEYGFDFALEGVDDEIQITVSVEAGKK